MSEFQGRDSGLEPRIYNDQFTDFELALSIRPDHLFESTHAAEWIEEIRVETNGKLDIKATAAKFGVSLIMSKEYADGSRMFADCVTGLTGEEDIASVAIRIRPDLSPEDELLIFGHEIGHIFLERVAGVWKHSWSSGRNQDVETFCEFFGREVVVSHDEFKDVNPVNNAAITELMAQYGASHQTIIFGLMLAGKLPTRVVLDSEIGKVPNPYYSGKVGRSIVCIECELGIPHVNYSEGDGTPVLDFRGYEWDGHTIRNECSYSRDIDAHIALNKHYGRWSAEDDALTEAEIKRHNETRKILNAYRAGGISAMNTLAGLADGNDDIQF